MQGAQLTLTQLVESHQGRLYGFLRCRVKDDATAQDLVQETWTEVWRRIDTYDPSRAGFWTFTRIWADIVLKRHWDEAKRHVQHVSSHEHADEVAASSGPNVLEEEETSDAQVPPGIESSGMPIEEALQVSQMLLELICRVASCPRPPHEIIVFGFSKLKWKPSEIVEELSDTLLSQLAVQLERDYTAIAPLPPLHVAFCPLRERLTYPLLQLVGDPRTRRMYEGMLERVVGETKLNEYYSTERAAEAVVTQWWDTVKRAVFTEIRSGGAGPLWDWLCQRMC